MMRKLSPEFKVGIFVLIVIAGLSFMTFRVGFFDFFRKDGFIVYVSFRDIAGLDRNTKIKIAGVDAGVVEEITLIGGEARLALRIDKDVVLYSDAEASIKATGLLGDKYLALTMGSEEPALRNGDTITKVQEIINIDDAVRKLSTIAESITRLTDNLNDVFGEEDAKKALKETLRNLQTITRKLDGAIAANDRRLRETLDSIHALARSLQTVVDENSGQFRDAMANIREFTGTLRSDGPELVRSIRETTDSLKNISAKIESGEGTIGKLVKDEQLYTSLNKAAEGLSSALSSVERFRTFLTFQGDYLTRPGEGKGYFYLTLQPREDKYYILGIVGDPLGRTATTTTERTVNGVTTFEEEQKTRTKIEFTAQFAKRFRDTAIRFGITENTFGVGVDQFLFGDRLKLTSDAWDFSNDEEGASSPHVRVGAEYFVHRHLFLSGGYDNIFNSRWSGFYVGAGIRFEDEDIKYLLGSVSKAPIN